MATIKKPMTKTEYICEACDKRVELDNKKLPECHFCGHRVLKKPATTKDVQVTAL